MLAASPLFNRVLMMAAAVVVCSLCELMADDSVDIKNASRGAEQFINDYLSNPHGGYKEVIAWVNQRPDVFPFFKERLAKLYLAALKEDPECGYGADAVMAGIEEIGTKYKTVDTFYRRAHIRVTLQAVAPAGCKHHVDVVMIQDDEGIWKVHSSGDIPM
jgi:glutaredoxin-related protein